MPGGGIAAGAAPNHQIGFDPAPNQTAKEIASLPRSSGETHRRRKERMPIWA
jgi:hypothetical protein